MNRNRIISFKLLVAALVFTTGLTAQKQSKTYKETFNVGDDTVLEINTTHTDIEFETWDKNQVEISAVVELEGASDEEAEKYFDRSPIEIKGNSREIEISTGVENTWFFRRSGGDFDSSNFDFNFVVPDVEPLFLDLQIPELLELPELAVIPEMPPIPPMPPMPFINFDYEQYKKDGDKYLKKWKKEFDKNFDEEYRARFEEWGEEMKLRSEEMKERLQERKEERERARQEMREAREEQRQAMREQREALQEQRQALREKIREEQRNVIISRDSEEPSIFYLSSDGERKKYKVKKTIKVKMPKSVKLKMNVRHGEVKLASTTKNINASLQYASLLASIIDGDQTFIKASYTPVVVEKWRLGDLKTDYAEFVNLKEVDNLELVSTSSSITIDKVNGKAYITNNLGDLVIKSIANGFSDVNVTVKNGEFSCYLPKTAVSLHLDGTLSSISYPSELKMNRTKTSNMVIHDGYLLKPNSGKTISVNSKYSEVFLKD